MNLEKLQIKKQELENEKAKQFITDADNKEIAVKVSAYEDQLIAEKTSEYEENKKVLDAQIALINELIEDEQEYDAEPVAEQVTEETTNL